MATINSTECITCKNGLLDDSNKARIKVHCKLKRIQSEIPLALADGMNDGEELCMNNNWKSKNRHKYLLQYHLIFVCE